MCQHCTPKGRLDMAVIESKQRIFGRLNELGFHEVQRRRNAGELKEYDDAAVREWLEIQGMDRLERAAELQERATEAAERSAAASEHSARFTMWAALIALVTVIVSIAKGCNSGP